VTRFCYCSQILPGKADSIRSHWANKPETKNEQETAFWQVIEMTGFECWVQKTSQADFLIHCLEGQSKEEIFDRLRQQIQLQNPVALYLQAFYQEVLGKDYGLPDSEPDVECLLDVVTGPTPENFVKKSFIFPLLPHKEAEHRESRRLANGEKKSRHIASLQPFDVYRLTSWLQTTAHGKYIVVYSERKAFNGTVEERLKRGANSSAWNEISAELMDQTGLSLHELSPDVEWLSHRAFSK
jgi:hypothetical protein